MILYKTLWGGEIATYMNFLLQKIRMCVRIGTIDEYDDFGAPTEDEIDQLLQRMSEDTEFQDELLMAGQEQTAADNASAMKTPAPDKKRKMEDDIEGEPAAKKTSPASVTETAAVEGQ